MCLTSLAQKSYQRTRFAAGVCVSSGAFSDSVCIRLGSAFAAMKMHQLFPVSVRNTYKCDARYHKVYAKKSLVLCFVLCVLFVSDCAALLSFV